MDLRKFFLAMSGEERERFAAAAGTTSGYIQTHLIAPPERRRIPKPELMRNLVNAAHGAFTFSELLDYFYSHSGSAELT
jgi:hypothetical protein